jgi:hypothetical protein
MEAFMASRFLAAVAPNATIALGLIAENLAHEKRRTGFHLVALGLAIPRRTALDDVRDVNIFAAQAHRFNHVVEQLTRAADEGFALRIFVGARSFAHEHQFGMRVANSENDICPGLVELAADAIAEILSNQSKRGAGVGDTGFWIGLMKDTVFGDDGGGGLSCGHSLSRFWLVVKR